MQRIRQSPTDPAFVQDPYPFYDRARSFGDLVFWEDYALPAAVTDRAVQAILRDRRFGREPLEAPDVPDHLADWGRVERHSMLDAEPPRHTRLRGQVLRAFTSARIAGLGPRIEALCHRLIDGFPGGAFDLLPAYCDRVPVIIIARLLGVPEAAAPDLLRWSHAMVAMYQAGRTRATEDAANDAARDFAAFLRDRMAEKRRAPGDDLLTALLAAGTLSEDEVIGTAILLLNAGHEATVHGLGNAVALLAPHPDRLALTGPATIAGTVEETLRLDPPLHLFTRVAYEGVTIFGHAFRRGDQVALLLAAANRDPAAWPDPGRLDVTRPARTHQSFGGGLHFCLGAPLARAEMQVALQHLFARCPGLRLTEPPVYGDTYHFRGLTRLMVTV